MRNEPANEKARPRVAARKPGSRKRHLLAELTVRRFPQNRAARKQKLKPGNGYSISSAARFPSRSSRKKHIQHDRMQKRASGARADLHNCHRIGFPPVTAMVAPET
jgi:hypothetical protein